LITLKYLRQTALWIIVDPWIQQPDDDGIRSRYPNIDQYNRQLIPEISGFSHRLKHCLVNCPEDRAIHPELGHLHNIVDNPQEFDRYTLDHGIKHVVYCGFHYGRCLLDRYTGARYADSQNLTSWMYFPLCCVYPGDSVELEHQRSSSCSRIILDVAPDDSLIIWVDNTRKSAF
jgi:hypothetical protein